MVEPSKKCDKDMYVELLSKNTNDCIEWDAFLRKTTGGTIFHTLKWKKAIEESYSTEAIYLVVRNKKGILVGVCPGFIWNSGPMKSFISLPYSDYGGPVLDRNYARKASNLLLLFIRNYCSDKRISTAKFCSTSDRVMNYFNSLNVYLDSTSGVMELDLGVFPSDLIWKKIFTRTVRKKIRRMKRELVIRKATKKADLVEFYKLYCTNLRYIQALPPPFRFFEYLWEQLYPENFTIFLLEKEKPIACTAFFKFGEKIYETYLGIDRTFSDIRRYSVAPYLSWELMRFCEDNGYRYYSQGKTPSNPNDLYHIQKASSGFSFIQQYDIDFPLNSRGLFFLTAKKNIKTTWWGMSNFLPRYLKRVVRKNVDFVLD